MNPPRVVDGRGLLPPEPMELTLAALKDLPDGDEVVLLLYREPFPLYERLARTGYSHRAELRPDGTFAIHIQRGQ